MLAETERSSLGAVGRRRSARRHWECWPTGCLPRPRAMPSVRTSCRVPCLRGEAVSRGCVRVCEITREALEFLLTASTSENNRDSIPAV